MHKYTQCKIHDQNTTSNKHVTNIDLGRLDRSISVVHEKYGTDKSKWKGSFPTRSFVKCMWFAIWPVLALPRTKLSDL